jgi:hypothetical protein
MGRATAFWRDVRSETLIEIGAQVRSAVALRRLATVDEVAGAYLHLMANGFVTGQVLARRRRRNARQVSHFAGGAHR